MNSKNLKVVDEHNIDRDANILFAFDLEGSGYVSYSINRDEDNANIFLSKLIRNLDGSFSILDIDDSSEKTKLNEIVKVVITNSVESQDDKLKGDTLTLSDGKTLKFIAVNFNKEQRINVQKTYITTVKKEVVRVVEKYYLLPVVEVSKSVEEIFPPIETVEPIKEVFPTVAEPITVSVPEPVVSTPVVEQPVIIPAPVVDVPKVEEPVVVPSMPILETPVTTVVTEPTPVVSVETPVAEPTVVTPTPVQATVESQPLVFNASKESNLNAALGEVANSSPIPVDNIEPIREFGVDTPVQQPVTPLVQEPVVTASSNVLPNGSSVANLDKKAGFANSKFFMVVAIAFFLASCIFLGYEVFQYFQLTK